MNGPCRLSDATLAWLLALLVIMGVDMCALPAVHCRIETGGLAVFAVNMLVLLSLALICSAAACLPGRLSAPPSPLFCKMMAFSQRFALYELYAVFLAVSFKALVVLSYINLRNSTSLIDAELASMDRWLGFNWLDYYRWVNHSGVWHTLLEQAYLSAGGQIFGILLLLTLTGQQDRARELVGLLLASCFITISAVRFLPAQGTYYYFNINNPAARALTSQFMPLRSSAPFEINFASLQGLVSIPSYHTCMAIIFCYVLRGRKWLFPAALLLNGAMLISTPYFGGHYLVDMLAGTGLCAALILLPRRWISTRPAQRQRLQTI